MGGLKLKQHRKELVGKNDTNYVVSRRAVQRRARSLDHVRIRMATVSPGPALKIPLDILWPLPFATQITEKSELWKIGSILAGSVRLTLESSNRATLGKD